MSASKLSNTWVLPHFCWTIHMWADLFSLTLHLFIDLSEVCHWMGGAISLLTTCLLVAIAKSLGLTWRCSTQQVFIIIAEWISRYTIIHQHWMMNLCCNKHCDSLLLLFLLLLFSEQTNFKIINMKFVQSQISFHLNKPHTSTKISPS